MKRKVHPPLSHAGQSDLRLFIAWYVTEQEAHAHDCFTPQGITTPGLTRYRTYLQTVQPLPPDAVSLFPSGKTREALSECALGYIVKKYARVAKLPDVSSHDLRHRFGYRMAESVPLHRLAQTMRHDSPDTTKLYARGTKRDLQQTVETIA